MTDDANFRAQLAAQTFFDAVASVRRQLIERGRGGGPVDVCVHLNENGWTAILWANYDTDDDPPRATFALPRKYDEATFPHCYYAARAMDELRPEPEARDAGQVSVWLH